MAKLVFLLDGNVIKEYVLDKERFTIGRHASNDAHIDNLGISAKHAVLVTTEDSAYIEDLNSTNGTVVNRKRIKKHMLEDGDLIKLGKYKLRYVLDDTINKPRNEGFQDTVLVADTEETEDREPVPESVTSSFIAGGETVETVQAAIDVTGEPAEKPVVKKAPRLEVLNGNDAGATLPLDKAIVKIGRPNAQLALVTKRAEGYFLSHVLGDDYPLVNGKPVATHAQALNNNDEIEMSGVKMAFYMD